MGSCSAACSAAAWREIALVPPSCVVLQTLQLPDGVGWSAVERSVKVVDPRQDQTARQRLCEVRRQHVSNVAEGQRVVGARSRLQSTAETCLLNVRR